MDFQVATITSFSLMVGFPFFVLEMSESVVVFIYMYCYTKIKLPLLMNYCPAST